MRILILMVIALMSGFPPLVAFAETDVHLHAQRTESKLIEVAVPRFVFDGRDVENFGWRSARIINRDLKFAGYFEMNRNYDFMEQAAKRDIRRGKVDFDEWRTLASNFLIKGKIAVRDNGNMVIEVRVYDLQGRSVMFSKRYIGARSIFRQIAHQFSDDFIRQLIGEKGVARSRIGYISRVARHKELFVMDYDGFSPKALTSDRSIVILPDWNPVADIILFTTYKYRNPDLYAIDLKRKKRYPISRKIGLNVTGEWSPDGRRVVFSLSRKGNSEIYVANSDGSNPRKLTNSRSIETSPSWGPQGKRIVYTSDRTGSPQLYLMELDPKQKSRPRRLTYRGGYNEGAAWSPKGDLIAYAGLIGGKFNIMILDINDLSHLQLTAGSGQNEAPTWAPNGRHLAFSSTRGGGKQIYIMNVDGGNQTRISNSEGGGYTPTWGPSPD